MRKHNNIYLLLALACLLAIVAIFIVDGYLGVYDTLAINNNQYTQTITPEQWGQTKRFGGEFSVGIPSNGSAVFTYTIENHRFSGYDTNLEAKLYYNGENVLNLYGMPVSVPAFGKQDFEWKLSAADIPMSFRNSMGTIKIVYGDTERQININIYAATTGNKVVPLAPVVTISPP